jgi:hypothetical protein
MPDFQLSSHAKEMIRERKIDEEWVWRTLETPTRKKRGPDGNTHYWKPIKEKNGRVLRVVVNAYVDP